MEQSSSPQVPASTFLHYKLFSRLNFPGAAILNFYDVYGYYIVVYSCFGKGCPKKAKSVPDNPER